jgi:hypothetical protein
MSLSPSDEGYIQDYDLGRQQQLFIYCRMCRSTFPVAFKPRTKKVKLRCLCGHEAPLGELDVFRSKADVDEHAAFYERVYRAAKDALRDAGIPMPPSGKYKRVEEVAEDSGFTSFQSEEDESDIRWAYQPEDESEHDAAALRGRLSELEEEIRGAGDLMQRHEALSRLVEWAYCRRHFDEAVYTRFRHACIEDIKIAREVTQEARRRKKRGEQVRLKFTSFKHLVIDLRENQDYEAALRVMERAAALGLKGYAEKAQRLRARIGL